MYVYVYIYIYMYIHLYIQLKAPCGGAHRSPNLVLGHSNTTILRIRSGGSHNMDPEGVHILELSVKQRVWHVARYAAR